MKIDREEARLNMQSNILCGGSFLTKDSPTINGKLRRHSLVDVVNDIMAGNGARKFCAELAEYYQSQSDCRLSNELEKAVEEYCSDDDRITEHIDALEDERLDNIAREKFEGGL